MKQNVIVTIIRMMLLLPCSQQSDFPVVRGSFLGQELPGTEPELFAPGIVADISREHSAAQFISDGTEVFWSQDMNQSGSPRLDIIMYRKQTNGIYQNPESVE